ncbi:hypothetical protein L211DRAFT_848029 [Terfezia boudieri ATCC MYA-4762]|uniref:Uncharacterized protein n=1 Tax=Terfezia boudieri ATCC MYA-4762 TaxID=1051890 RepID=A0A3N4LS05_9PEZI|nr:hypothetical protein L211DRAFT_848029 [Terfezia boudieri ATCC MYA-4762]
MYRASKVVAATPNQRRTSGMREARITSDGGLRRKRRDQLHELEGNKRVRFQEALEEESAKDITEVSSDEFEDQEEPRNSGDGSGSDVVEIKQLQHSGRKTRSFASIPHKLQGLCYLAQTFITDYTFFKLPFLSALDIINLVDEAWDWAQEHEKSYLKRTKACPTSYLNVDKESYVYINWTFRELKTGKQVTEAIDFKYETAATTFHRLRNTWGLYDEKVRGLILANIKADLRTRIGGFDRKAETEASDPCALVEGESYISELREELRNTMSVQNLAGSDAWSEETVSQCSMGIRETIRKMYENTEGSQREETPTDIDEPPEVDENRDWQESQVPY